MSLTEQLSRPRTPSGTSTTPSRNREGRSLPAAKGTWHEYAPASVLPAITVKATIKETCAPENPWPKPKQTTTVHRIKRTETRKSQLTDQSSARTQRRRIVPKSLTRNRCNTFEPSRDGIQDPKHNFCGGRLHAVKLRDPEEELSKIPRDTRVPENSRQSRPGEGKGGEVTADEHAIADEPKGWLTVEDVVSKRP